MGSRRRFIKCILGIGAVLTLPLDIILDGYYGSSHNVVANHCELLDTPLRKVFFNSLSHSTPEYTRWIEVVTEYRHSFDEV